MKKPIILPKPIEIELEKEPISKCPTNINHKIGRPRVDISLATIRKQYKEVSPNCWIPKGNK